jgi:hypothetical protein
LDDLTDEARDRFLEFMGAEESDYNTCPVAMVMSGNALLVTIRIQSYFIRSLLNNILLTGAQHLPRGRFE